LTLKVNAETGEELKIKAQVRYQKRKCLFFMELSFLQGECPDPRLRF
jgi:hypothetical protein